MRFFTIDTRERGYIELTDVDGAYWVALIEDGQVTQGIPLSPFFSEGAKQLGLKHIQEGSIQPTPSGPVVTITRRPRPTTWRRREPDVPALLHVKSPEGLRTELTQATFDEYVEDDRVHRRYHEFALGGEPPPGISVLAELCTATPQHMLMLLPNAAFRILHYNAENRQVVTLSVRWSGHDLDVKSFRPFGAPSLAAAAAG
jgi:hypothetical protein